MLERATAKSPGHPLKLGRRLGLCSLRPYFVETTSMKSLGSQGGGCVAPTGPHLSRDGRVASTGRVGGQGDGATGSKQPEDADDFLAGKGLARRVVAAIAVRRQPQMQPNPTGSRSCKRDPNSKDLPLTSVDAIRSDFAFLDDWEGSLSVCSRTRSDAR